jgi:2-methylisocitrate lyase-like PEP mutase family enzyme
VTADDFRAALEAEKPLVIPIAYDAMSARVIEEAGFRAVGVGGFLGAGSWLGVPDIGLFTATEAIQRAANMALAIDIPMLMDIDTGYGNAINVRRTIEQVARAGVAAVHLEDQVFPKRCGQFGMGAMRVISLEEGVSKIRAARDARGGDDVFVVARTDAWGAGLGVEEAVRRGAAYADAGADAVMAIIRKYDDLKQFAHQWERDTPLVAVPTRFATVPANELGELGFSAVCYTEVAARAALFAVEKFMRELREKHTVAAIDTEMIPTEGLYELVKLPWYRELEEQYGALQPQLAEAGA